MKWSDEQIAQLRQLWDSGISTREIARRMGISKSAVVGKAHRIGCPSRGSPIIKGGPRPHKVPPRQRTALAPMGPPPVALVLRTPFACCWPLGEPGAKGFRFCGVSASPGRPYCAAHCKLAYLRVAA